MNKIQKKKKRVPFDAFGEISLQANNSYTFTIVLYKIHMAISSFSYIFHQERMIFIHLLYNSLSVG